MERNNTLNALERREQKTIDEEIRATISISIIVLIFLVTSIPLQISYLISIFYKGIIPPYVVKVFINLLHLNSAINPIIYAYRMRDIRRAIWRLFGSENSFGNSSTTQ